MSRFGVVAGLSSALVSAVLSTTLWRRVAGVTDTMGTEPRASTMASPCGESTHIRVRSMKDTWRKRGSSTEGRRPSANVTDRRTRRRCQLMVVSSLISS